MTTDRPQEWRRSIGQGLVTAGLLLQTSILVRSLTPDYLSPETALRIPGLFMGVLLVGYANATTKTLTPLARMRCDPSREQALRRFAGWSLTLGGVAYTATWMLAPIELAKALSTSFLGASVMLVIIRLASSTLNRRSA